MKNRLFIERKPIWKADDEMITSVLLSSSEDTLLSEKDDAKPKVTSGVLVLVFRYSKTDWDSFDLSSINLYKLSLEI